MNEITLNRPVKSVFIPLENRISVLSDKQDIELQIQEKCDSSYNKGYEDGIQQGRREQKAVSEVEMQMLKQHFQNVMSTIPNQMKKAYQDMEDMAAALCLNIAKKVIHKEIENKEHIITLIRTSIQNISDKTTLTIRMNPSDLQMLREEGLEIELAKDVTTLNIVEDMEIDRGGCVIEHNLGQVNAKIEDQIATLDKNLANQFTQTTDNAEDVQPPEEVTSIPKAEPSQTQQSMDEMLEEVLGGGQKEEAPTSSGDVTPEPEPKQETDIFADVQFPEGESMSGSVPMADAEDLTTLPGEADIPSSENQQNPAEPENNSPDDNLGTDNADKTDV